MNSAIFIKEQCLVKICQLYVLNVISLHGHNAIVICTFLLQLLYFISSGTMFMASKFYQFTLSFRSMSCGY